MQLFGRDFVHEKLLNLAFQVQDGSVIQINVPHIDSTLRNGGKARNDGELGHA